MKKRLSIVVAAMVGASSIFAQTAPIPQVSNNVDVPMIYDKTQISGDATKAKKRLSGAPVVRQASSNGTTIGDTYYDLQTNAAVDNRLIYNSDGTMSAAWTMSQNQGPSYTDRGTGYNYWDGSSWGTSPTARLESERVGWPSIMVTSSGVEIAITHSTDNDRFVMMRRTSKGTGTWTANTSISTQHMIWPRAVIGGANGETIHLIAVTAPVANGGTLYQGLDGALLYYRSTNAGLSWDKVDVLMPEINSTHFTGFGGDQYAITADGDNVAFAVFNDFADGIIMKSDDNGDTWTKLTYLDFPIDNYVIDQGIDVNPMDGVPDTVQSTDNSGDLMFDDNGKIHLWFGNMRRLDADLTDGNSSYFPGTNGLMYWNEDMEADAFQSITGALDINGDGTLGIVGGSINGIALYFLSLASMANVGKDANGNFYLTYSAMMENYDDGNQNYRHTYVMMSDDEGCTWYQPLDVTDNGVGFEECVFGSMADNVDTKVRLIFQEDISPGLAVRGDEDPDALNEIVYTDVNTSTLSSNAFSCPVAVSGIEDVCPGDTISVEANCGTAWVWKDNTGATIGTNQDQDITSSGVYSVDVTTACGTTTVSFEVDNPQTGTGAGPNFNLSADYTEVCVGDPVNITANNALVGSTGGYNWGTGFTTQNTFTGTGPGTYIVTVTNCVNDVSIDSITIGQITGVTAAIDGDAFICPGGNTELAANDISQGVYSWDDGTTIIGNTRTIQVTSTGTYNVTVTACGVFTDVASIQVQLEPQPTASVNTTGSLEICEGGLISLGVTSNVDSILWSNGSTAMSIPITQPSETGDYFFTAYNKCGDQINSDTVSVTVNAKPTTPTITKNAGVFTSDIATNIQWYVNGNAVSGATSQNFQCPVGAGASIVTCKQIDPVTMCESDASNSEACPVGYDENQLVNGFILYPNPNRGTFTIVANITGEFDVEVTNILGEVLTTTSFDSFAGAEKEVDLGDAAAGVYMVNINGEAGKQNIRVIVE